MVKIQKNTLRLAGITALLCLSLACFAYINSIAIEKPAIPETIYVEELDAEDTEVLPDVELIKRIVKKAFEFMSMTNL